MTLRGVNLLLSAVGIALIVYVVFFLAIVDRISRMIGCAGFRKIELVDYVDAWGVPVPLWCVALLWLFLPIVCFALGVTHRIERLYRDAHGMCVECGYRLTSWHGKCPGCGVRIGPG